MSKTSKSLITALALSTMFGCNKEPDQPSNPPLIHSYSGYLHAFTQSAGGAESEYCFATFVANDGDTTSFQNAGNVTLNGTVLDRQFPDSNIYQNGNGPYNIKNGCNWAVSGGPLVPAFTYNYNDPIPTSTNQLPDTIYRATGATFSITAQNATDVTVVLDYLINPTSYDIPASQGSFTITPAMLQNVGSFVYVEIGATTTKDVILNNRKYLFQKSASDIKIMVVL